MVSLTRRGPRTAVWAAGRRRLAVSSALVLSSLSLTALTLAAYAGSSLAPPSAGEGERHAVTAGNVMTRSLYPVPAVAAAWEVTGRSRDTTIDALTASGTTWAGSIVLRVDVSLNASTFNADRTTRCYRYTFAHRIDDATPHALDRCPPGPALVLTAPPPGPDLSATRAAQLDAFLQRLNPAQQHDPTVIAALLVKQFPSPSSTSASQAGIGVVSLRVAYADRCLLGQLGPGDVVRSTAAHGTNCQGG